MICFEPNTDSYRLLCGHAFCRPCLRLNIHQHNKQNSAGIACPWCLNQKTKKEEREKQIYLIDIISLVSPLEMRLVYNQKIDRFLAANQNRFRRCTTPNCESILAWKACYIGKKQQEVIDNLEEERNGEMEVQIETVGDTEKYEGRMMVFCDSCGNDICFRCGNTHYDNDCENFGERKEILESGIRVAFCPSCGTGVEKSEGCNHITCNCGCHFCFLCGKAFNEKSVYNHMTEEHGAIFD